MACVKALCSMQGRDQEGSNKIIRGDHAGGVVQSDSVSGRGITSEVITSKFILNSQVKNRDCLRSLNGECQLV